jgi:hypothetical protein
MIDWDTETAIKILVPCGQLAVAGAVGMIAYWQWRTAESQKEIARSKLLLEMFDRRTKIFDAVTRSVATALLDGKFDNENLSYLREGIRGSEFLFGTEVSNIVNEIYRLSWLAQDRKGWLKSIELLKEKSEDFTRLVAPYMNVSNIKSSKR